MSTMPETRNIVFLGASYGGMGAMHYFARHVYPHLPKDDGIEYRVIVVDPSEKWYLRHASPRHIISDSLVPEQQIFVNTIEGIQQYGEAFSFVQGSTTAWNPESRTLCIDKADGSKETLPYHALILATGTRTTSPLFSLQGKPHTTNQDHLQAIRKQLTTAKRIVIAGGGPAGVETAGELGEILNGTAGWFSSRPANPKVEITLYTASNKLLPVLRPAVAKQAESYLNLVGVDVVYNAKIASASSASDGKIKVKLQDGSEIVVDVYIPATGLVPMTEYVPKHLLDDHGYIKANAETTRVENVGPRVFAVGDVADYSDNSIVQMMSSIPVAASNLKRDLLAAHKDVNATASGPDRTHKANTAATQLVPIGRNMGVGEVFGWWVPSFFVWLIKSRTFMIDEASVKSKLMGGDWKKESVWKDEPIVA